MAFKWGNLFNELFGPEFMKKATESGKTIQKAGSDLSGLAKRLAEINKEAKETAGNLSKFDSQLKKLKAAGKESTKEYQDIAAEREAALNKSKRIEKSHNLLQFAAEKEKNKIIDGMSKKTANKFKTQTKSITSVIDDFTNKEMELRKQLVEGKIGVDDFAKGLHETQFKKVGGLISNLFEKDFGGAIESAGNFLGNMGGELIGGPLGEVLGKALTAAYHQVFDLNKSLVELQRATGGLVTANKLGYDAFGNSTKGLKSLQTAAIEANVNVQQFGDALKGLFGSGPGGAGLGGQIIGLKDNLDKSADALQQYGIQAAQIAKQFGAEIGPAVAGLMKNFGKGIKDSTALVGKAVDKAIGLGLNVQAMVGNLEEVVGLAGDLYFKTTQEMERMATLATKLGTSVNAIAHGIIQMKGINQLFEEQQKMAALGLSNTAKNLSKIYALRQTGKQEEAARTELIGLAKDMGQYMDMQGNLTQQGIAMAQAAGANQEQIQNLQRMSRMAQDAGVSLEKMIDPTKAATEEEKKRIEAVKRSNMTLEEQFNQTFGMLKQAFLDPLAAIIGPIVKAFMDLMGVVVGMITPVLNILGGALQALWSPIQALIDEFMGFIHDVFDPLKVAFNKISDALKPVFEAFKKVGSFFAKFIMAPVRLVGKILGKLFGWLGDLIGWISDKIGPVFNWIGNIFSDAGKIIDDAISAIAAPFKWLATVPPLSWFGLGDVSPVSEMTPSDWAKVLNVPEGGVVNPAGVLNGITPNHVAENQQTAYSKGTDQQKLNEEGMQKAFTNAMKDSNKSQPNVIVKVDPIFNNKQTVKNS